MASDTSDTQPRARSRRPSAVPEPTPWSGIRPPLGGEPEVDPWAWTKEQAADEVVADVSHCVVTAVLVCFDAERWLPETLAGLSMLSHRPQRLIAIDCDSHDATPQLLQSALQRGTVDAVYHGRHHGFGDAVAAAIERDAQDARHDSFHPGAWIWLLHDDAVPEPDALLELLRHVVLDPTIDVTGPKLLLPTRRTAAGTLVTPLAEVGVSISGTGRRDLHMEPGEIDQGQRDEPQECLGVSTCGMLVRASTWAALEGLDPALPLFRDGVDFGWRAHQAGYRVVTTPAARLTHRQVGRAGLRPRSVAGHRPDAYDRGLGMLVVTGHASRAQLPLVWLRVVAAGLARALGYLLGKVPGRTLDEFRAIAGFAGRPGRLHRYRRRLADRTLAPGSAAVVRSLRPPWWATPRAVAETVMGAVTDRYRSVAGELDSSSLDELTGDDFAATGEEPARYPWLSPIVVALILSLVGALIAGRGLWQRGLLSAPALLPASDLADLWHSAWAAIPGAPGQLSPPWIALTAVGATLLAGQPDWFVTVLLCFPVPLAVLTSYPVLGAFVADRRVRVIAAVSYALLAPLLGGTNQGRISLGVVAILLPLFVAGCRAIVVRRARAPEAWRGGWGAGVVLAVLVAYEPALGLFAALAALLGALALVRTPRKAGRILLAVLVPLVVWAPWLPSLVHAPGRLLVGPDAALGAVADAPAVWLLLLGRDTGAGLPPLWVGGLVFGALWLLGLAGLVRAPRRRVVPAGWVAALLAFTLAVLLSRLVVAVPPAGTAARPWVGALLLVGFAGLLTAGAAGLDGVAAHLRGRAFSWLQPASLLASLAAALVLLTATGWWIAAGAAGPVQRRPLEAIPPYVRVTMRDQGARVLAVDLTGGTARYVVLADDLVRLGDADRGFTFGGARSTRTEVRDLVVRLVAGTADDDIAPQLRDLGIGYVWVRGASSDVVARVDNTPGLGPASGTESVTLWQIEGVAARVRMLAPDGSIVALSGDPLVVPPGNEGRLLLLGEAADLRWRASVDGRALPVVERGWQQGFLLPAAGGSVAVRLVAPYAWLLPVQGTLLLVAVVLAAPAIRRPDLRDPTLTARRAARLPGMTGGRR